MSDFVKQSQDKQRAYELQRDRYREANGLSLKKYGKPITTVPTIDEELIDGQDRIVYADFEEDND